MQLVGEVLSAVIMLASLAMSIIAPALLWRMRRATPSVAWVAGVIGATVGGYAGYLATRHERVWSVALIATVVFLVGQIAATALGVMLRGSEIEHLGVLGRGVVCAASVSGLIFWASVVLKGWAGAHY